MKISTLLSPALAALAIVVSVVYAYAAESPSTGSLESTAWLSGLFLLAAMSLGCASQPLQRFHYTKIVRLALAAVLLGITAAIFFSITDDPPKALSSGRALSTYGTVSTLLLLAIALIVDHWQSGPARGISRMLASLTLIYVFTLLVLYFFDVPIALTASLPEDVTAWLDLLLLFLIGAGIVALHPERGLPSLLTDSTLPARQLRVLLPAVTVLPVLVGLVAAEFSPNPATSLLIAVTSLGSAIVGAMVVMASSANLERAEKALFLREQALLAAPYGVVITDHSSPDEPVVWVNPAFERISGYGFAEIEGKNCRVMNSGLLGLEKEKKKLQDAILHGTECSVVMRNRTKDGRVFWNQLSISPVIGFRSRITHFVGIMEDITEDVESSQKLENSLKREEKARAVAERATNARDTFVSFISHELRAPLNAAQTWLDLMQMDDSAETRETGFDVVRQSVETQTRLIQDLGDIARLSSGRLTLEPTVFDLAEALNTVAEELRPEIESEGLTLLCATGPAPIPIEADEVRILQVARNLLVNAKRYTPAGGTIELTAVDQGAHVEFAVRDTGIGLTGTELRQIFKPYWRANTGIKGLGIGLSLTQAIVEGHNGTIRAVSAGKDEGACFTVTLRRSADDAADSAKLRLK